MSEKKLLHLSEEEKLRNHLKRSYTERFYILIRLIKLNKKLSEAKITYPEI